MSGTPSGVWDDATQKAMQRFQADNGWQAKETPDSRALIKLGLGPGQEHLLNPESAMTTTSGGSPEAIPPNAPAPTSMTSTPTSTPAGAAADPPPANDPPKK